MKKLNAKAINRSLLLGIPLSALVATLGPIAPSHATGLFAGFGDFGRILIDPVGVCFANNTIDFKTLNSPNPCATNQFGTLGNFEVTGATGGFAPTNPKFADLFGSMGDITDLIAPGLMLPTPGNGEIPGLPAPNVFRFDVNGSGTIGDVVMNSEGEMVGDMVFDATRVFVTEDADAVTINFKGAFKEIASVSNYNTLSESITYVPGSEIVSSVAVLSGGIGGTITSLSVVGNMSLDPADGCSIGLGASTPNIIVDPNPATNPCIAEFGDAMEKDFTSIDGVVETDIPEPSNLVGLLAVGSIAATTVSKRKQTKN
jgi:hypothetical protein